MFLKKFTIDNIENNSVVLIYGKNNVEKSISDILEHCKIKRGCTVSITKNNTEIIKIKKHSKDLISIKKKYKFLIIKDYKSTKLPLRLFTNSRFYNVLFICNMQYPILIQPSIRYNIDFIIVHKDYDENFLIVIYDNFFKFMDNFLTFKDIYDSLASNECLILDNQNKSNKLEDKIFWYELL